MKNSTKFSRLFQTFTRTVLGLAACAGFLAPRIAPAAGTWIPVKSGAPGTVGLMLLLPDGTVMAASPLNGDGGINNQWFRLIPDVNGHYVNGSWTTRQSAGYSRVWFSSQVLQNGKVFVAGGEYGSGGNTAELYDPQIDQWFSIAVPDHLICTNCSTDAGNGGFRDSSSVLLPNGTVLIEPVFGYAGGSVIFDPTSNTLSPGPKARANLNEAGWVKLADSSILCVDDSPNLTSERFIPSLNEWITDTNTPVALFEPFGSEEGPLLLLPNKKVFVLGGTGHTCIYTPSGTTNNGSWVAGPDIPLGLTCPDAAAAMMVNGKILVAACPAPTAANEFNTPTSFFEYDYLAGTNGNGAFTQVDSPTGGLTDNISAYHAIMLALPDGTVLYSHFGGDLYIYNPDGNPLPAGKPTISSVTANGDGSFHVTGTLFNGISGGAAYGDDAQMNTDYPLVQLLDDAGTVTFARTYGWSGTTEDTGSAIVSTEFVGTNLPPGAYSLKVAVNGFTSDAVTFYGPVWVDFNYTGATQNGQFATPYSTLAQGASNVVSGGIITIKSSTSHEILKISKPMTITTAFGTSTVK